MTGLQVDVFPILFVVILDGTFSYIKKVCCKTVCGVTPATASYIPCSLHLLMVSFSLVLDLISCCFIQKHAVQVAAWEQSATP